MKKIIYSLLASVLISLGVSAQSNYSEELGLTKEQSESYQTIQKELKQSLLAIENLRRSSSSQYAEKREAIYKNIDKKIKSILNDKQWAMYDRLRQQRDDALRKID